MAWNMLVLSSSEGACVSTRLEGVSIMAVQPTGTQKDQKTQDAKFAEDQKRREMGGQMSDESGKDDAANRTQKGERKQQPQAPRRTGEKTSGG
jgi:hypothetical protein